MLHQSGSENGIDWSVTQTGTSTFQIVAVNSSTGKRAEHIYTCMHTPLFGLDVDDVHGINHRLDAAIKQVGEGETA